MTIPQRLTARRCELGLSQTELARQIGVTRSTLCRWEAGKRIPDWLAILEWAQALGCELGLSESQAAGPARGR